MRRTTHLLLLAALAATPAAAQITNPGQPVGPIAGLAALAPTETLPPVDVPRLLAEDEARGKSGPWRYGELIPAAFSLENSGAWSLTPEGDRVWRLRVSAPGALSVGFEFAEWELPEGSSLWLYDDAGTTAYGAYGAHNNKADGRMATMPFPGDAVVLEYVEPAEFVGRARLTVESVVHGYRDVLGHMAEEDKSGSYAGSGGCNIDVNCPQGADWQDEKRAVCRTLSGGALCSGALINNSSNDGTQYLLTANHCGSMNGAIFLFNYERNGCSSGSINPGQSVQGSTLMAASSSSDYRLVRVNPQIPASYGVYYAGWNKSSSAPSNTVGIHHPSGDIKKICFDNDPPTKNGSNWRIADWELGVTEGGSSGSPLFNGDGQIIGQLCCGQAYCGFVFNDYYGRMDLSFGGLSSYLDPVGSGAVGIGGYDPNGGGGGGGGGGGCANTAYGGGVSPANAATLSLVGDAKIGNTVNFSLTNFGASLFSNGLFIGSTAQASVPFGDGTILVSQGAAVITNPVSIVFGVGTTAFFLPNNPALVGLHGYFQAGVQDPSFAGGYAFTNALDVTFCN
jgi:lysyl endopeptidase